MSAPHTPWIVAECANALSAVLESMTGAAPTIDAAPADLPAEVLSEPDFAWRRREFTVSSGAMIWLGAPASATLSIGESILAAAGISDLDPVTSVNTYDGAAGQVFVSVAQALSQRLRREVTCVSEAATAPELPFDSFSLDLHPGEPHAIRLYLAVSPALCGPLTPLAQANTPPKKQPVAQSAPPPSPAEPRRPNRLDLLLDVELPVSVSFGQSELALKDVIKLTTGSIIELNRTVSEPVEVIVNNCVIARGEVVVVEGNFGVRIQQVISRQERLKSIQ